MPASTRPAALAAPQGVVYRARAMTRFAVRELRRRAVRSTLTALGIAIGAAALVLLGALAEKTTRLIAGGRAFAAGQITIGGAGAAPGTGMMRGTLLTAEQLEAVRAVPGVRAVAPIVMFPLAETPTALPFTLSPLVFGVDVALLLRERPDAPPPVAAGHLVPDAARDEVVIGAQVARLHRLAVGDTLLVRSHRFRVAGVLAPTLSGPDSFVFMPFPHAQRLLLEAEPVLRRAALVPGASLLPIATSAAAFWEAGTDPETVAERIRERVPGLSVISPARAVADLDRSLAFLNAIVLGSAVVALLVAALAVTTATFTAGVERRREIGLQRVAGATRAQVLRQLLLEAALLGVGGGIAGLALGALAVGVLNDLTARVGAPVFLVTVRLAAAAVLLPTALAVFGGLWPARRAARLPLIEALRWA